MAAYRARAQDQGHSGEDKTGQRLFGTEPNVLQGSSAIYQCELICKQILYIYINL